MKKLNSIAIDSTCKDSDFDAQLAKKKAADEGETSPTPKKKAATFGSSMKAAQGFGSNLAMASTFGSKIQAEVGSDSIFGSAKPSIFGSTEPSIFGSTKLADQSSFKSAFSASKDSTGTSSFGALLEEAADDTPDAEEEDATSSAIISLKKKEGKLDVYLTQILVILTGEEDEIRRHRNKMRSMRD